MSEDDRSLVVGERSDAHSPTSARRSQRASTREDGHRAVLSDAHSGQRGPYIPARATVIDALPPGLLDTADRRLLGRTEVGREGSRRRLTRALIHRRRAALGPPHARVRTLLRAPVRKAVMNNP